MHAPPNPEQAAQALVAVNKDIDKGDVRNLVRSLKHPALRLIGVDGAGTNGVDRIYDMLEEVYVSQWRRDLLFLE